MSAILPVAASFLTDAQCQVLSEMLADALDHRYPGACGDCDDSADGLCDVHQGDLLKADEYIGFGRQFGVEVAQ